MTKDRAIIIFNISGANESYDLDVPLDISADELFRALNAVFALTDRREKISARPETAHADSGRLKVILKGKTSLGAFGIGNASVITYKDGMLAKISPYGDHKAPSSYPIFKRKTRLKTVTDDTPIKILDAPPAPAAPEGRLTGSFISAAVMASFCIAMSSVSPYMAVSGALGMLMALTGLISGRASYRREVKRRREKYLAYAEKKAREIEDARDSERDALAEIYIPLKKEKDLVENFSPEIFDRHAEDEDFLRVRLGTGTVEAKRLILISDKREFDGTDDLTAIPEKLRDRYKYVRGAPVVCDLKEENAVGIVGKRAFRYEFLKNMALDISVRHDFADVKMIFVAKGENKEQIRWLRHLPHAYNDETRVPNVVCDDDSKDTVFEWLYKELSSRQRGGILSKCEDAAGREAPRIVVFLYDEYGFRSHPLSGFVNDAGRMGVTFVFFADRIEDIARGCGAIVRIKDAERATIIKTADKRMRTDFIYPNISDDDAHMMVRALAPVRAEEISLEADLTKKLSFFEMLGIGSVSELDIGRMWRKGDVTKSMSAPIGVSRSEIVSLDVHDGAHGPHGLMAGTTGSGKSELLTTYVLSMAVCFHPYDVSFVIIDFKGGGMTNRLRDLPHLIGTLTNIDEDETERFLRSLRAQITERQLIFAKEGVNHIDEYIRRRHADDRLIAMPHLIVIVDEFAELKVSHPEFMKELISMARIGRSLGIHLILATQKPSGQVDEQIWGNCHFKLCLKVQSREDSSEVLRSPLASEIRETGRAYLKVGNNEIFELFQSAYCNAPENENEGAERAFTVYRLTESAERVPVYVKEKKETKDSDASQLSAVIKRIKSFCEREHIRRLPEICLPPLGRKIAFPEEDRAADEEAGAGPLTSKNVRFANEAASVEPRTSKNVRFEDETVIVPTLTGDIGRPALPRVRIGIYDDPDHRRQGEYIVNLTGNNVLITGPLRSGKTNILQSVIRSIAASCLPTEAYMYIIDFGSMFLRSFEELCHVGGVVTQNEDEKLKNLMKLLSREISERREKLISAGAVSYEAYVRAGRKDMPLIVVIIDNMTALTELYFQDDDSFLRLCRDGAGVGISIVSACPRAAEPGFKYLSCFSCRISLCGDDRSEDNALPRAGSVCADKIPGRCLVRVGQDILKCQAYLSFGADENMTEAINSFIGNVNAKYAPLAAPPVPVMPERTDVDTLLKEYKRGLKTTDKPGKGETILGMDYETVAPFAVDLMRIGQLALCGGDESRQILCLRAIADMTEKLHPGGVLIYAADDVRQKMASLRGRKYTKMYEYLPGTAAKVTEDVWRVLKGRYEDAAARTTIRSDEDQFILFMLNGRDAAEEISGDAQTLLRYRDIVGKYKSLGVCAIIWGIENSSLTYAAPEVIRMARDSGSILYFEDLRDMKFVDLPFALIREYRKTPNIGDCCFIGGNTVKRIKLPETRGETARVIYKKLSDVDDSA